MRVVVRMLGRADRDNYRAAVGLIVMVGRALVAAAGATVFDASPTARRAAHGRTRKFISLLDGIPTGPIYGAR